MKYLIIKLSFLITFFSYSKEIILKIEGSGRGKEYEVMQFENNSKYPLEYDPRGIIGKSIRELAATQAEFKFITRRV